MGDCGCSKKSGGGSALPYVVVLADGTEVSYRSEIAARARIRRNAGSHLKGEVPAPS